MSILWVQTHFIILQFPFEVSLPPFPILVNKKTQLLLQALHATIPGAVVLRAVIEMSPKQAEGDQQDIGR